MWTKIAMPAKTRKSSAQHRETGPRGCASEATKRERQKGCYAKAAHGHAMRDGSRPVLRNGPSRNTRTPQEQKKNGAARLVQRHAPHAMSRKKTRNGCHQLRTVAPQTPNIHVLAIAAATMKAWHKSVHLTRVYTCNDTLQLQKTCGNAANFQRCTERLPKLRKGCGQHASKHKPQSVGKRNAEKCSNSTQRVSQIGALGACLGMAFRPRLLDRLRFVVSAFACRMNDAADFQKPPSMCAGPHFGRAPMERCRLSAGRAVGLAAFVAASAFNCKAALADCSLEGAEGSQSKCVRERGRGGRSQL